MDAVTATAHMSADEFLARPGDPNGFRWELIEGEVVRRESTMIHNRAWTAALWALETWSRGTPGRGRANLQIEIQVDERNVYVPDVVWYGSGRAPSREDLAPYPVPDLVVDVRSPTWRFDIGVKKASYERRGLGELWLVDTAADQVFAFRRSSPDAPRFDIDLDATVGDTLTSPLLPGFELAVREFFAN